MSTETTPAAFTFNPHYSAARSAGRLDSGARALSSTLYVLDAQGTPRAVESAAEWAHSALLGLDTEPPAVEPGPLGEWARKAALALSPVLSDLRVTVAGDPDLATEITNLLLGSLARLAGQIDMSRIVDVEPTDAEQESAQDGDPTGDAQNAQPSDESEPQDLTGLPVIDAQGQRLEAASGLEGEITAIVKNAVIQGETAKRAVRLACGDKEPGAQAPRLFSLALQENEALRRILEAAGKISAASAAEMRKSDTAKAKVIGMERGGDVSRILAPELAGLRHPALRAVTLAKIAQRETLQYRLGGEERVERGPMVLFLDESESMTDPLGSATRFEWAKAVVLSALQLCAKQRRELYYVTFDDTVNGQIVRFPNLHKAQVADPSRKGLVWHDVSRPGAVADLMVRAPKCGGTSFDRPLQLGVQIVEQAKVTARPDLIFVTDGYARVSPIVARHVEEAKKRLDLKVRLVQIGVAISRRNPLAALCDTATAMLEDDGGLAFAKVITL